MSRPRVPACELISLDTVPAARSSVVARAAPVDRRAALGAFAGLLAAGVAGRADAYVNAAQMTTGGLGRTTGGRGSMPKSSTEATASGYTLEGGIKKASKLSPERKAALIAEVSREHSA